MEMDDHQDDFGDGHALQLWIDKLDDRVERQHASLQQVQTRSKISARILRALEMIANGLQKRTCSTEATCKLLTTTKVIMRDRRGIHDLLTIEALHLFLSLAEGADLDVAEEAMKCVINSVYSRPDFVRDVALPHSVHHRLLALAQRSASASFHLLVWKALLVSCEANEMIHLLVYDITTWKHIHETLHFCLYGGDPSVPFPSGRDRTNLLLELAKLLAVLVNDLKLGSRQPPHSHPLDAEELVATLQPLGDLLLDILRFSPTHMSPYTTELVDLKNKIMEIFMFIPTDLLGLFVHQQSEALKVILSHLYTMLVLVRIEKTRLVKELQPVLVACHHLTSTGDPGIKNFFRLHLFPAAADGSSGSGRRGKRPAPPAFFHKHLTFFLTSLDTTIKRCTGEWLYLLCDQNADEYTKRTGIGNAIGLLRIKGLA